MTRTGPDDAIPKVAMDYQDMRGLLIPQTSPEQGGGGTAGPSEYGAHLTAVLHLPHAAY
jgi:hypothetical protein